MTIGDRNNTDTLYVKSYTTPAETVPIPILTSTPDTLHNPSINVSHSSKTCFAKKAPNNSRVFVSTPIPTPNQFKYIVMTTYHLLIKLNCANQLQL